MKYGVFQCIECGNIQTGEIRKTIEDYTFKCRRCGKIRKIKYKKKFGLSLNFFGIYNNAKDAAKVASYIKMQRGNR